MSNGNTESKFRKMVFVVCVWIFTAILIGSGIWAYRHFTAKKLEKETSSESLYKDEVKIGADAFSGYSILRSKVMMNECKLDGLKLNIVPDNADYVSRLKDLRDGKLDLAVFTVDALITAGIELGEFPLPATIVLVIDETKGADAFVAYKSEFQNIDSLNKSDVKFVLTPKSPTEFLGRVLVSGFNLPNLPEEWIEEADGSEDVYKKFLKASKSAPRIYGMWEPFVSKALKNPDVYVPFGSDKIKGYIVDVLVVNRKFLNDNTGIAKTVVKSYLKAAYSYKDNMASIVLEDDKTLGKEDAANIIKGIQWKNTLENFAYFRLLDKQQSKGVESLEEIIAKITKVLIQTDAITQNEADKIKPLTLFYDGIMKELQAENFHPGKKLDFLETTAKLDEVRGDVELPELTDEQWNKLVSVGQMQIKPLSFRTATAELNIQSKRDLEDLATMFKSMPLYYLLVTGNSRAEGDIELNKALAKSRAEVVVQHLVLRLGIDRNRIKAIAAEPSNKGGASQSVTFQLGQRPY